MVFMENNSISANIPSKRLVELMKGNMKPQNVYFVNSFETRYIQAQKDIEYLVQYLKSDEHQVYRDERINEIIKRHEIKLKD
jgi:pantothenate kinase